MDDSRSDSGSKPHSERGEQETCEEGSDDANDQVADQAEAATRYESSSKPPRDDTYKQDDEEAFDGEVHGVQSRKGRLAGRLYTSLIVSAKFRSRRCLAGLVRTARLASRRKSRQSQKVRGL